MHATIKHFFVITYLLASFFLTLSHASIETYQFDNPQQEADYKELIFELRCLVCQNQNLADSNAGLAKDLREQVHKLLVEDKASKQDVIDYMVARYGEFVLYKPPVESHTLLLWAGPLLFLVIGLIALLRFINAQKNAPDEPLDPNLKN
ncbi:cytochrome c-type biogenesis protein CcmH [Thiomicrorhabdus indica]|uniref:cytochrome c-type biogenesis protein n=1 Tax=Thiomicrorhabdus indica TaxID=2267253 RepID=UPI00102DFF7E|nr:cytochrome c-type biogenesis protein [Thiomicrorhabdus indica]